MAVPFRKVSKTRGRKRRTHYVISANTTTVCPKCGEAVKPHRVCKMWLIQRKRSIGC